MARQHVHNRRAGRGGGGSYWISYSDIMAALVLMFVLFLIYNLYHYNLLLKTKQDELAQRELDLNNLKVQLDEQQTKLDEYEGILIIKQGELDARNEELAAIQLELDAKNTAYNQQTIILIGLQQKYDENMAILAARETEISAMQLQLEQQEEAFRAQAARIDSLVGVRSKIVQSLSRALEENNIKASVDANGDITLQSSIFFETGKSVIKKDGQEMLNRFLPVYLSVLMRPEYRDFIGEIIVEGHTDSDGGYITNLKLSQDRALSVASYCLEDAPLNGSQKQLLQRIMTAKGRSYNDLIYYPNGTENKDASRRVEFKFSLKDSEMIEEMNRILNSGSTGN